MRADFNMAYQAATIPVFGPTDLERDPKVSANFATQNSMILDQNNSNVPQKKNNGMEMADDAGLGLFMTSFTGLPDFAMGFSMATGAADEYGYQKNMEQQKLLAAQMAAAPQRPEFKQSAIPPVFGGWEMKQAQKGGFNMTKTETPSHSEGRGSMDFSMSPKQLAAMTFCAA